MLSGTARAREDGVPMTMRWTRGSVVAAGALAVTLMLASCGGSDGPTSRRSPSSVPTESTSPSATASISPVDQRIINAYDGMWADMVQAARTADYRSPKLAAHTVDPATGQLRRTLLTYSRLGIVVKGELQTHPHVTSLNQATGQATLTDCLDDTHWLTYYQKTGELTDNKPGGRTVTTATLRQADGRWQVSSYMIHRGEAC